MISVQHKLIILRQVFIEQKHITTVLYGKRYRLFPRHRGSKADHRCCIRNDESVESQFFTQQIPQKFFRKGCRDNLMPGLRCKIRLISRHRDMPCHDRQDPVSNQSFVYFSIGRIPFLHRQTVDGSQKMLVSFIHAVPRKMLDCSRYMTFFCPSYIFPGILTDRFGVISVSPYIRDWTMIIQIDIDDRRKCPVNSDCRSFRAGNLTKTVRIFLISGRRTCHLLSIGRSVRRRAVSARL